MGLGSQLLTELLNLRRMGALVDRSRVIEIGAQQLSDDFLRSDQLLDEIYQEFGGRRPDLGTPGEPTINAGVLTRMAIGAPPSRPFWESIGWKYAALDFDGHRDSIPIDLNRDAVPAEFAGTFDLVVNSGTTEHVANQNNAFQVIHDLVDVGGIMVHDIPAGGLMTHGLFAYNPTFFWHLTRENSYQPLTIKVCFDGFAPIPGDVFVGNEQFGRGEPILVDKIPLFTLRAALRKVNDAPFVTPLDLPTDHVKFVE